MTVDELPVGPGAVAPHDSPGARIRRRRRTRVPARPSSVADTPSKSSASAGRTCQPVTPPPASTLIDRMVGISARSVSWCSTVVAIHTPSSHFGPPLSRRTNTILSSTYTAWQPNIGRVQGSSTASSSSTKSKGSLFGGFRTTKSALASRRGTCASLSSQTAHWGLVRSAGTRVAVASARYTRMAPLSRRQVPRPFSRRQRCSMKQPWPSPSTLGPSALTDPSRRSPRTFGALQVRFPVPPSRAR